MTAGSHPLNEEALKGFQDALLIDDAEALYQRAPCGYLSTTPDGTIVKVNQTFLTWTGYGRDDLVAHRTFADLLSAGGRIYHETHYAPMLRLQGRVREIALDIVCADGRRLPALINSVLERDAAGAPVVVRTAVFEATERRQYERELLRAKQRAEESEARVQLLARTLQGTLIPPAVPDVAGLDVAAVYRPAGRGDEVGGDFYDVFEIAADDWVVVVGDVCGKGVEAAVLTAGARHSIRGAAVRRRGAADVLRALNDELLAQGTDRFLTAVVGRLRRRDGAWTLTLAVGGHPPPLLLRAGAEPVEVGRAGSLVGVLREAHFHDTEVVLHRGDSLVLSTDGVTEGRRGRDFYGSPRLRRAAADHQGSAASLTGGILDDVLAFQQGDPHDDIVIVAVCVPRS